MNTIVKRIRGRKRHQLVEFDVDVEIDVYALAAMLGQKALANKSGKTALAAGLIKVSLRGQPQLVVESGTPGPARLAAMLPRIGK